MLNLQAISSARVRTDPFDHFVANDVVPQDVTRSLLRDFPAMSGTGSSVPCVLRFGRSFEMLLEDLRAAAFSRAVGERFGCDLTGLSQLVTIRGRSGARDGYVHTDADWKLMTALLYLNPGWRDPGGRLRLLRSADIDNAAVEIPPEWGTLLVFRRSARSFHGHKPFFGERRLVQVSWVTHVRYVEREERRHRRSATFKGWLQSLLPRAVPLFE